MTKAEINKKWKKTLKKFIKTTKLPTPLTLEETLARRKVTIGLLEELTTIMKKFPDDIYFCKLCGKKVVECACEKQLEEQQKHRIESYWPKGIEDMCK